MKKRRTIIISFILAAVLVMGVGYAALTDVLDITGTSEVKAKDGEAAFNTDVKFIEANNGTGYTANINPNNDDKAAFTITEGTLQGQGDSVTATFKIGNVGDLDATVSVKATSNTNEEYFDVTNNLATPIELEAGGEAIVTITVTLKKTPTKDISGTFVLEMNATTVETTVAAGE